jgi:phosphopantetheine adenylyltransferase
MQSTDERISAVKEFLDDVKPSIFNDVVPITDPFGPTITDEDYQCLVVSQETLRGGNMVNTERQKKVSGYKHEGISAFSVRFGLNAVYCLRKV